MRPLAVRRALLTRAESQDGSTPAKRLAIRFQLVPLRALLESPTRMTKRLRAWRVDSTMQWGPGPMRLPKAARNWRRGAAEKAFWGGAGADEIGEGREELEEECSRMRFGVGREAVDNAAGGSVEGGVFEFLMGG